MRRSVREAIVGFSIVGAIAGFGGTMLWLRGVRLGSDTWTVTADFANAGGLAARSPVTFRGIMVGTVRSIDVTPTAVKATLDINTDDLKLPLPVKASVISASLLGVTHRSNWSQPVRRSPRMRPTRNHSAARTVEFFAMATR